MLFSLVPKGMAELKKTFESGFFLSHYEDPPAPGTTDSETEDENIPKGSQ